MRILISLVFQSSLIAILLQMNVRYSLLLNCENNFGQGIEMLSWHVALVSFWLKSAEFGSPVGVILRIRLSRNLEKFLTVEPERT